MFAPFKIVALLLLALWLPATLHCDLETAGIDLAGHGDHHADASPCATDACEIVEDGDYAKTTALARALPPTAAWQLSLLIAPAPMDPAECQPAAPPDGPPELEALRRTWQFVQRTALPARAPGDAV